MSICCDIKDKTALVTGANRGIGRAIVESILNHGAAKVYAAVRTLETTAELVRQYKDTVVPLRIDLGEPETIAAAAKRASDVDVVVNNAGVLRISTPLAADAIKSLEYEMTINVYGVIHMAQSFAPVLRANGGGAFVQLNSVASMKCFSAFSTYCASKAAAYAITQALRELLAEQGTLVISVHPGPIATKMADDAGMTGMAEPASIVGERIVDALKSGDFHVFPDKMANQIWMAYENFAREVVEADLMGR